MRKGDDAKQDGISAGSRNDDNDVGGRSGRLYVRTGIGDRCSRPENTGDHGDEPGENQRRSRILRKLPTVSIHRRRMRAPASRRIRRIWMRFWRF